MQQQRENTFCFKTNKILCYEWDQKALALSKKIFWYNKYGLASHTKNQGDTYAYKGKTDYTQINCKKGLNRANMFLYEWLHGTKKSLELQQDNIL